MLISGGLNVYPAEVEAVLTALPGVAECAVIGVPDERWGETPVALVGAAPGATLDPSAILAHCREHLADYKLPRFVVVRDEPLPRGMSGKVLKRQLPRGLRRPGEPRPGPPVGLARRPCGSPRSTAARRWRFPRRAAEPGTYSNTSQAAGSVRLPHSRNGVMRSGGAVIRRFARRADS